MKYISFGLTAVLVVLLIIATLLEKLYGTPFVIGKIYGSPIFILLWGVTAVASFIYLLQRKVQKQLIAFSLHLSFMLILLGAFITHVFGVQGAVHLRQGVKPISTFIGVDGSEKVFPFQISLKDFNLVYYPGTFAPMDFVSTLVIHDGSSGRQEGKVSMNHIYDYNNYRFYQSKYDADSQGTTLSVSYDPYGIGVTYLGYASLLLSMLFFFFQKNSGFRVLLSHPLLHKGVVVILLIFYPVISVQATNLRRTLPKEVAGQFGDLYLYYNDRVCPLQTLAKDFTVKLYGKPDYRGLTPEQVLTGWFFYYDDWKEEPIICIKSREVQSILGIDKGYACLTDFMDVNGYKLEAAMQGDAEIKDRKAIESANEQFNLIGMVGTGSLLAVYPYHDLEKEQIVWYSMADKLPADIPDEQWVFIRNSMNYVAEKIAGGRYDEVVALLGKIKKYQRKEAGTTIPSDARFKVEKLYNRMDYNRSAAMICITIGILAFIFYCRRMIMYRQNRTSRWQIFLNVLMGMLFIYLSVMIVFRGYIGHHPPLSNGFETMQFMAWCSVLLTVFLQRKFKIALAFGFLLCGLSLMVAMMGEASPQITQLMPVLSSPLLSIHVVTIMFAYSLLAFMMLGGITAVVLYFSKKECRVQIERLQIISRILLYPAVFLLTMGIFMGAVWANVSWGRYWGWDPKEVWALITMLVYSFALHPKSLLIFHRPMFFHVFSIVAFLTVLATYFGVNFLLGGMHSYN